MDEEPEAWMSGQRLRHRGFLAICSVVAGAAGVACGDEPADVDGLPPPPIEVVEGHQPLVEDYEILGEVRYQIWSDEQVGRRPIGVDVHRGVVTLTGVVNDAAAKRRAVRRAEDVPGVRAVVDRLRIAHRPYVERRREVGDPPSDATIEEAVRDAWRQDARLEAAALNVRVRDGVALITGRVRDPAVRRAAEADARHTVGVIGVRNLVEVERDAIARAEGDEAAP